MTRLTQSFADHFAYRSSVDPPKGAMTRPRRPLAGRGASRAAFVLAASLLALASAGCGGDDGGDAKPRGKGDTNARGEGNTKAQTGDDTKTRSVGPGSTRTSPKDTKAIRTLLVSAFTSDDPDITCTEIFTARLLRDLYDDRAGCRRAEADDEDDKDPDRVVVSAIEVRGRRASARIQLVGGDSAGTHGALGLADEDGGWRLDDLSLGFLRSAISAGLAAQKKIPGAVARCMDTRLERVPDRSFKELAYASIGKKPQAERRLVALLSRCERATGRTTIVRRKFQEGIAKSLRGAGAGGRVIACVTRRLRRSVSDEALIGLAGMKPARQRPRVRKLVLAALAACGARNGNDRPGQAA